MNYNILAYILFATITTYIILWVGKQFHRNGRIFILSLFDHRENIADTTNNLLLTCYYLFNMGYAIIQISFWEDIYDLNALITSIAHKTGILILLLAVLHFNNMFILYILSKNKTNSFISKQT